MTMGLRLRGMLGRLVGNDGCPARSDAGRVRDARLLEAWRGFRIRP